MNTEALLCAIGEAEGIYVLDAHREHGKWRRPLRYGALAACVCLLAVLVIWRGMIPPKPAEDPSPVAPIQGDWPVVFNETDTTAQEDLEYYALFSEEITPEQLKAVLPERVPDSLTLQASYTVWFGWNELESVGLHFCGDESWSGHVRVTIRPAGGLTPPSSGEEEIEETAVIPTRVEEMDVVLYKTVGSWGEELHTTFTRRGGDYTVTAFVEAGRNYRKAEADFFQMVVSIVRGGRELSFEGWKPKHPFLQTAED
ncbi:MAG: hypothetical protein J5482_02375 [Oscillospiraceae bacterium]|nr:hypothetical protein [Oscillospiraceae bacterium]